MNKTFLVSVFLTLIVALHATVCQSASVYSDKVVAVVNKDIILESDIAKYKQPFMRNVLNLPLGIVPPGKWPTEREILDELIVIKLLEQEAARKGINLDDKAVEAAIDSLRKRNKLTKDQFVMFLAAHNLSYQEYKKLMTLQFKLTKLIESEVTRKIALSEEDAQKYFLAHKNDIDSEYNKLMESLRPPKMPEDQAKPNIPTHEEIYLGGKLRLRQITLKIPPDAKPKDLQRIMGTAKRIFEEASAGADFGKLAKKYSEDPWAKNGGDLGLMDYREMVPGLQKMVQRMKQGDVTPPLRTKDAVVLFYLEEAKGRQTKQIPIPEKTRKELEKKWKQTIEQREKAQGSQKDAESSESEPTPKAPSPSAAASKGTEKARSLGILSPEEEKEYEKVRNKVALIVRHDKMVNRMKEWIDELKKSSIIDVKM
jgi:peptidyl-prolyl cis-trans isomerase SurA